MINIGATISSPGGACSFYRSVGPFSKIKEVSFSILKEGNWQTYSNLDIIYMERPVYDSFVDGAKMAKAFNLPLWIDFDDDLFEIPHYNPANEFFSDKNKKKNIEEICEIADVITVTTEKLKERFSQFNRNVIVVPNALNDFNFPIDIKNPSDNKIISWRGSGTHRGDLMEYRYPMIQSMEKNKDWIWAWFGDQYWMVSDDMDQSRIRKFTVQEIIRYFSVFHAIAPGVHVVPLKDNFFNRCKSNIAWLEATSAGAVTLGPAFEEWDHPGITRYESIEDFGEKLNMLCRDEKYRRKVWNSSLEYIKEHLLLSKVNQKRIAIINALLSRKPLSAFNGT